MDRFWFLTWTTYGTWLPGDDRGFVTELRDQNWHKYLPNQPGTEYPLGISALKKYAESIMLGAPIWFSLEHANALLLQFQETSRYRGWKLFAVAVMSNHIHILVGVPGDPDPSDVLGDFKEYGSRALNRKCGKPANGTWWSGSGSKRKLADSSGVRNVTAYIRDQFNPLLVWLNSEAIRGWFEEWVAEKLLIPETAASGDRQVAGTADKQPAT